MNVLTYNPDALTKSTVIPLGRACECRATRLDFTVAAWLSRFPGGSIVLYIKDPNGEMYLADVTVANGVASWVIRQTDTTVPGYGALELALVGVNGEKKLSAVATTKLEPSLVDSETDEEQMQPWLDRAAEIQAATETAARAAATHAAGAYESADAAAKAREAAEAAAEAAKASAEAAKASAEAAEDSEQKASGSAEDANRASDNAANSATLAAQKAEEAWQSAAEAARQATTAGDYASEAEAHARAAEASRQAAQEVLDSVIDEYAHFAALTGGVALRLDASGGLITINDGAAVPVESLVTVISAAQGGAGNPSPDNVREIIGRDVVRVHRTRRNLLLKLPADLTELTYVNSTSGENKTVFGYEVRLPAGNYQGRGTYKDGYSSGVYVYGLIVDAAGATTGKGVNLIVGASGKTVDFTLEAGEYLILYDGAAKDDLQDAKDKFGRVNLGIYTAGNDTTYEECEGDTLTAELPETVYGGTLDWMTGVLTVTNECKVFDGTETLIVKATTAGNTYFQFAHKSRYTALHAGDVCSHLPRATSMNGDVGFYCAASVLNVRNSACATADEMLAWLVENKVAFKLHLVTPYTVQLTPQQLDMLHGLNNVWSDCGGDTSLLYVADLKLYIDGRIAAIAATVIDA